MDRLAVYTPPHHAHDALDRIWSDRTLPHNMIRKLSRFPPAVFGLPVVVGLVANMFLRRPFVSTPAALGAGIPLVVAGSALVAWAFRTMLAHGQTPDARHPKTKVVTSGPFRISRNPMYLGFEIAASGAGLVMNSVPVLVSVAASAVLTQVLVVYQEERYLASKFPDDYAAYRRRVRRWL
jgi:protein-S-isoprenylcysteine O-methyltransferase Ste14